MINQEILRHCGRKAWASECLAVTVTSTFWSWKGKIKTNTCNCTSDTSYVSKSIEKKSLKPFWRQILAEVLAPNETEDPLWYKSGLCVQAITHNRVPCPWSQPSLAWTWSHFTRSKRMLLQGALFPILIWATWPVNWEMDTVRNSYG